MTFIFKSKCIANSQRRGWDKSPSLSIVFGLSSKAQWLSGLYYADFISFYSPTQLCGGGTTKSNSNELLISVPLSLFLVVMNLGHPDCGHEDLSHVELDAIFQASHHCRPHQRS